MRLDNIIGKFLHFTKTVDVNNLILLVNSVFLYSFLSKLAFLEFVVLNNWLCQDANLVYVQSCQKECVGLIISSTLLRLSSVLQKVDFLVLDFE